MRKRAPTARKPQQSNAQGRGGGDAPPRPAPRKVTLGKRGAVDTTALHHHPRPRLPRALPAHLADATPADESTSVAIIERGDTLLRTTTQDPFHVLPLLQGVCGIALDEVNLLYSINCYSLKAYRPLQGVKQSGTSARSLTYLPGLKHGIDTYALGLPTIVPWPSS